MEQLPPAASLKVTQTPDLVAQSLLAQWMDDEAHASARHLRDVGAEVQQAAGDLQAAVGSIRDKIAALERQHEDAVALFEASQKQPAEGKKPASKVAPPVPWAQRKLGSLVDAAGGLVTAMCGDLPALLGVLSHWAAFPEHAPEQTVTRNSLQLSTAGGQRRSSYTQQKRNTMVAKDVMNVDSVLMTAVQTAHTSYRMRRDDVGKLISDAMMAAV